MSDSVFPEPTMTDIDARELTRRLDAMNAVLINHIGHGGLRGVSDLINERDSLRSRLQAAEETRDRAVEHALHFDALWEDREGYRLELDERDEAIGNDKSPEQVLEYWVEKWDATYTELVELRGRHERDSQQWNKERDSLRAQLAAVTTELGHARGAE